MDTILISDKAARFGWIYSDTSKNVAAWDEDLTPHSKFATLTTLGPIIPNWLLLIPRVKALNFAVLPAEDRAQAITQAHSTAFVSKLENSEKQIVFEHGAFKSGSSTGCGVDQAHLHVISGNLNISDLMDSKMNWRQVECIDPWSTVVGEYLFVSDFETSYICDIEYPTSQHFRKKIAGMVGKADEWDYKSHPKHDIAAATSMRLKHDLKS